MFSGLFVPDAFLMLCRAQSLIAIRPLRQHGTQNVSVTYMDFCKATAMAINPKYRAKASSQHQLATAKLQGQRLMRSIYTLCIYE